MKFLELHFPAYGPFTDFRLDFEPGPGLYLIYGPNESGKSSALRAVRALLYGMTDGRDEYLHPADSLRLHGLLERSGGETFAFGRRKGRGKKTLIDAEGKPQEPELLEAYLGGVDVDLFDRLYGLDHRTLSLGGKALLEEGGKVGESLFAAGLGPGFRQVRDSLKEEADKLYKPRGRTLGVDRAVEAFRAAQKRAQDLSVSAESWRKIASQMEEEDERAATLEVDIRRIDVERQRLRRYLDAHKPLAQREFLLSELAAQGELPELPADFSERRQQLQSALAGLRQQLSRNKDAQASLARRTQELPAESNLLQFAQRIDRLHRSLEAVEDAEARLPVAGARVESNERRLKGMAADLGLQGEPDGWGPLPDASQRARARRLAERYRRLVDEQDVLQSQLGALSRQRALLKERLDTLGEPRETTDSEASLRRLRMALGLDTEISGTESSLAAKSRALEAGLVALPHWTGPVEELAALKAPDAHRIAEFEREDAALEDKLKEVRSELRVLEERGKKAKAQLSKLREREKVRSREDLSEARRRRQEAWEQVLGEPSRGALSAMERAVRDTDELTDRLLDDAARVSELDRLTVEYEASRGEWPQLKGHEKEILNEQAALRQGWRELWKSPHLSLQGAAKMREWLARRETVLALAVEVRSLRDRLEKERARRETELASQQGIWRELLAEGLGLTVSEAIERAERALTPLLKAADERRRLAAEDAQLRATQVEAEAAQSAAQSSLAAWRAEWGEVATVFRRDASAEPSDLESLLERYEELRALTDEQERSARELDEQTTQITTFRQQVEELAGELGEAVAGEDLAHRIERWVASLEEVRRFHTVRQQLAEQAEMAAREGEETARALSQRESDWARLLQEAGLKESAQDSLPSGLAELEAKVVRRRTVTERLRDLEETLRPLAGGQSLDELSQAVHGLDWDTVPGLIRDLDRQIDSLEAERSQAWHRKGQLEQELRGFDGAEAAALAAQEAAEAMAEGKATVARYARLALAETVLNREMERYRRENEGPVLRGASEWFTRLTCAAYAGLTTGLDPRNDQPRLEALHTSGRHVPVEALSDGTRDQLFLALRLATIAQTLDSSEPIPLILDDVLVHFDGERAQATLEVLAEFAQRTQVLLFSHLERDKQLAAKLAPERAAVLTLQAIGL